MPTTMLRHWLRLASRRRSRRSIHELMRRSPVRRLRSIIFALAVVTAWGLPAAAVVWSAHRTNDLSARTTETQLWAPVHEGHNQITRNVSIEAWMPANLQTDLLTSSHSGSADSNPQANSNGSSTKLAAVVTERFAHVIELPATAMVTASDGALCVMARYAPGGAHWVIAHPIAQTDTGVLVRS